MRLRAKLNVLASFPLYYRSGCEVHIPRWFFSPSLAPLLSSRFLFSLLFPPFCDAFVEDRCRPSLLGVKPLDDGIGEELGWPDDMASSFRYWFIKSAPPSMGSALLVIIGGTSTLDTIVTLSSQ